MTTQQPKVYFGGTFDPIHNGHISLVRAGCEALRITNITLIPCHIPPHKGVPSASGPHRWEMLRLFCESDPLFSCDDRELHKNAPSYTVHTLRDIRLEMPDPLTPIWFFIGQDSLQNLHLWHQWQRILTLSHLIVLPRNDSANPLSKQPLPSCIVAHISDQLEPLYTQPGGTIYQLDGLPYDISSSQLRERLANAEDCSEHIPAVVYQYIQQHSLYQLNKDN